MDKRLVDDIVVVDFIRKSSIGLGDDDGYEEINRIKD